MKNNVHELYVLEDLAHGGTCVHALHPTAKLLSTAFYLITVVSFDRYAFGRLIPYVFYPALLTALSGTPYSMLFKRFLIALPFCLFAGITNLIVDRTPAFALGDVTVSLGAVSLCTVLLRTYLCVMAILALVSVTPLSELTGSMRRMRASSVFVTVFEMTYRYIGILFDEAYSMYAAYSLRKGGRGVNIGDMGSFVGQLLLRGIDRAERVYDAMKCRGYALNAVPAAVRKFRWRDWFFCAAACLTMTALRVVDVSALFAGIFGGLA